MVDRTWARLTPNREAASSSDSDEARGRLMQIYPDDAFRSFTSEEDMLNYLSEELFAIRTLLQQMSTTDPPGAPPLALDALETIGARCDTLRANVMALRGRAQPVAWDQLTGREREIADMIVTEDLSNAQVSSRLGISEATVKTHVSHVLAKLGAKNRRELSWLFHGAPRLPSSQG